jgi:secreted PhoX family phosphatase
MAKTDQFCNRAEACEAHDDVPRSLAEGPTIGDVIARRYSRRTMMRGTLGVTATLALFGPTALTSRKVEAAEAKDRFDFEEAPAGVDERHHVAPGYRADILLRWGDPIFADAPNFDPRNQSAAAQLKQFGYNNDYVGFIPFDGRSDRGLLCINHEWALFHAGRRDSVRRRATSRHRRYRQIQGLRARLDL